MKKINLLLLVLLIATCLVACFSSSFNKELIYGEWQLHKWTDITNNKAVNGQMNFTFNENERYIVDYGSEKEEGKYWLMGTYLHTVEDGMAEKKVEIQTLTQDSLVFEMNRAGTIERVVLLKK